MLQSYRVHKIGFVLIAILMAALGLEFSLPTIIPHSSAAQTIIMHGSMTVLLSIAVGVVVTYGYQLRCYWVFIIGLMALAVEWFMGGSFIISIVAAVATERVLKKNNSFGMAPTEQNLGVRHNLFPIEKVMIISALTFGISLGLLYCIGINHESSLVHNEDWWYVLYTPVYLVAGLGVGALIAEGLFRAGSTLAWHFLIWAIVIIAAIYLAPWYSLHKPILSYFLIPVPIVNLVLIELYCKKFNSGLPPSRE
ncbi:MAG: hypothetical protein Q7V63_07400 [Gammaproteobacteria bacterium]|nr:hypothetical protein [Gammaproteobacteria bacterium]